jgi:hypothetical protein
MLGPGQAHVLEQGQAAILVVHHAAALHFWHSQIDKVGKVARIFAGHDIETVGAVLAVSLLHLVRNVDGGDACPLRSSQPWPAL